MWPGGTGLPGPPPRVSPALSYSWYVIDSCSPRPQKNSGLAPPVALLVSSENHQTSLADISIGLWYALFEAL